jgi:hypothetical protein
MSPDCGVSIAVGSQRNRFDQSKGPADGVACAGPLALLSMKLSEAPSRLMPLVLT